MRFRALGSRLSLTTAEQVLNYRLGIVGNKYRSYCASSGLGLSTSIAEQQSIGE
jgi:hypothetical protein